MEWRELLDDYEEHLNKVQAAMQGTGRWPGEYQHGSPSVVLPTYLEPRAKALVSRTASLAAEIRQRMGVCQAVLEQSRRREPSGRVVLVDVRA